MSSEGRGSDGAARPAVLLLAALVILAADQLTKALVVASLAVGERVGIVDDLVQFWHAQNAGAAFSLFQGGTLIFLAVSILSVAMVAYFHRALRERGWWLHLVLGMVLGGTLGNLVDRVRQGYVTAWVSVGIGELRWPTFNVADASLVVGICVLVVYLAIVNPDRREAAA